ncbi:hypothetical protein MNBD_BACTEROID01-1253 [hydrothermal vent metagenome]|uniref:Uncharacterized protein n=1 Tax=hydrothermal vent metagenome TaxID=652676 RepID=A0A3B0TVA9_9ZZZZ
MIGPSYKIPAPITFNPFKHHKTCILQEINNQQLPDTALLGLLNSIGDNYIDIYTGSFTPKKICTQVLAYLKNNHTFNQTAFEEWVGNSSGYKRIKLTDDSFWIVRKGVSNERYIHIHPAKTGPLSIRFKASTLKTIYWLKRKKRGNNPPRLKEINEARLKVGLPPVKQLKYGEGILKCWGEF